MIIPFKRLSSYDVSILQFYLLNLNRNLLFLRNQQIEVHLSKMADFFNIYKLLYLNLFSQTSQHITFVHQYPHFLSLVFIRNINCFVSLEFDYKDLDFRDFIHLLVNCAN